MRRLKIGAVVVVAAAVLAGCALQTPAPVVGRYERSPGVAAAPTERFTDRVSARAAGTAGRVPAQVAQNLASPRVQSEDLSAIEPAAGEQRMASLPARPTTAARQAQSLSHTVQAGDTVYSLSRRYNTTPGAILQANRLESAAVLEPGMLLVIPAGSGRLPHSADSLGTGVPFNLQPKAATAPVADPYLAPASIEPAAGPAEPAPAKPGDVQRGPSGQRYRLLNEAPQRPATPAIAAIEPAAGQAPELAFKTHTVQAGETLFRIAKQHGSSVIDLMAVNDFAQPQDLKAGTVVRIPLAQQPGAPAPAQVAGTRKPGKHAGFESALDETRRLLREPETPRTPQTPLAAPLAESAAPEAEPAVAENVADNMVNVSKTNLPDDAEIASKAAGKRGSIDKKAARTKGLAWPVRGEVIRRFGEVGNGVAHSGINIQVPAGTPVVAAEGGHVIYAGGGLRAYGNMVLIRHPNGMVTAYAHNHSLLVEKGDRVKKGQVVALSGNSGNVDKPQLHFEIRRNAQAIDPLRVLGGQG